VVSFRQSAWTSITSVVPRVSGSPVQVIIRGTVLKLRLPSVILCAPTVTESEHGGDVPLYQYRCQGCGREQELFQTIAEGEVASRLGCPFCPEIMSRIPSRVNAIFKGTGWTPTHFPNRKGKA
jgi:putative FmdB family regulatory protein